MTAAFVTASSLFGSLHRVIEDPAREALAQFVQRCNDEGYAWSVAELMFLYALGVATVTASVVEQRTASSQQILHYINDELQASFLMFLDAENEGEAGDTIDRPTADAVAAGDLDAEARFYYEVLAIALEGVHGEADAFARGDAWSALTRAVDRAYSGWCALVARHAGDGTGEPEKAQLLTSCSVVFALRVLGRLHPTTVRLAS